MWPKSGFWWHSHYPQGSIWAESFASSVCRASLSSIVVNKSPQCRKRTALLKTEHSHPLWTVQSTHFWVEKRLRSSLENGAYPFILAKNAENAQKKRSIAVHLLRWWWHESQSRTETGALPFILRKWSCCHPEACSQKTEHYRSLFPLDDSMLSWTGALPFIFQLYLPLLYVEMTRYNKRLWQERQRKWAR